MNRNSFLISIFAAGCVMALRPILRNDSGSSCGGQVGFGCRGSSRPINCQVVSITSALGRRRSGLVFALGVGIGQMRCNPCFTANKVGSMSRPGSLVL